MQRTLEPEWLDDLPPQDARAVRSRSDLRRVNWVMGNARLLSKVFSRDIKNDARVADLGSGDGRLMLRVARPGLRFTLVDRAPVVSAATLRAFQARGCSARVVASDALTFLEREEVDVVVANLFLHHLDDSELSRLLAVAADRCRLLVACEPERTALALAGCRLLRLLGCNDVTRHDARVSVRAGFRGDELSRLWPSRAGWILEERRALPFSHLFVARRHAS